MRVALLLLCGIAVVLSATRTRRSFRGGSSFRPNLNLPKFGSNSGHSDAVSRFTSRISSSINNKQSIDDFRKQLRDELAAAKATASQANNRFRDADTALQMDAAHADLQSQTSPDSNKDDFVQEHQQREAAFAAEQAARFVQQVATVDANDLSTDEARTELQDELGALTDGIDCPFDEAKAKACKADSIYREQNARCTSRINKIDGMTNTAFDRVMIPAYEDGFAETRKTGFVSGQPLESARKVSTTVTRTNVVLDSTGPSVWLMQWGQFMAHEYTHLNAESGVSCCPEQIFAAENGKDAVPTASQLEEIRETVKRDRADVCIPILVPEDDRAIEATCIQHTRLVPTVKNDCLPGPRQQVNAATGAMDASVIYGSDMATAESLRSHIDGKMEVQSGPDGDLLPAGSNCPVANNGAKCPFASGDDRVNTTPNLQSAHTIFVRKHNQICDELKKINRHWDDERLFQEARRIIAAIEQHIHYNEWLQNVLGGDLVSKFDLTPQNTGFFVGTDENLSVQTSHECAAAACRFGHSLVGGFFTSDSGFTGPLHEFFNKPDLVYDQGVSACTKGMNGDRPWVIDRNYDQSMRDKLFGQFDIIAFNLNRGRDVGLRSYVDYRQHYGLSVPKTFDDMLSTHPQSVVDQLKLIYSDVGDVELYIAGVTEEKARNAVLGETFGTMIADEFIRKKKADRFYFEAGSAQFSQQQVNSIRGYSLARLICDTTTAETFSPNAFLRPEAAGNAEVSCSSLSDIDWTLWEEDEPVVTTAAPPQCNWVEESRTKCCRGKIHVTRECRGDADCDCTGPRVRLLDCNCRDTACRTHCRKTGSWGVDLTDLLDRLDQERQSVLDDVLDRIKSKIGTFDWRNNRWD